MGRRRRGELYTRNHGEQPPVMVGGGDGGEREVSVMCVPFLGGS